MKILMIISNKLFLRNYLNKYVLDDLKKIADVKIIVNKKEINDKKYPDQDSFTENFINSKIHNIILTTLLFANVNKSKSFYFRIKTRYFPQKINKITFRSLARYLKKLILYILFKILTYSNFISKIFISILKKFLTVNKSFEDIINREKPDLVLMPTNGYFSFEVDAEYTLHKLGKKYISLVDNWDNLSTKTLLIYKANHYGLWGDQTRIHAQEIQNISPDITTSIGTPRYEIYKNTTSKKLFNFKYILFVGTSNKFDEFAVLVLLNNIFNKFNIDMKIVYRPHPWRESDEFPDISILNNIILDPQMEKQYNAKSMSSEFQPELEYYTDLVGGSEFVIGGFTSMLIEAQLQKKHYVGLAHKEPNYYYSPKEWLNAYTHFSELFLLKNLTLIKNLPELEGIILKLLNTDSKFVKDNFLSYFLEFDEEPYGEKLVKLIKEFDNNDKQNK
jgi:hypothetical protein